MEDHEGQNVGSGLCYRWLNELLDLLCVCVVCFIA